MLAALLVRVSVGSGVIGLLMHLALHTGLRSSSVLLVGICCEVLLLADVLARAHYRRAECAGQCPCYTGWVCAVILHIGLIPCKLTRAAVQLAFAAVIVDFKVPTAALAAGSGRSALAAAGICYAGVDAGPSPD